MGLEKEADRMGSEAQEDPVTQIKTGDAKIQIGDWVETGQYPAFGADRRLRAWAVLRAGLLDIRGLGTRVRRPRCIHPRFEIGRLLDQGGCKIRGVG